MFHKVAIVLLLVVNFAVAAENSPRRLFSSRVDQNNDDNNLNRRELKYKSRSSYKSYKGYSSRRGYESRYSRYSSLRYTASSRLIICSQVEKSRCSRATWTMVGEGMCVNSTEVARKNSSDEAACKNLCFANVDCAYFSYPTAGSNCTLFSSCVHMSRSEDHATPALTITTTATTAAKNTATGCPKTCDVGSGLQTCDDINNLVGETCVSLTRQGCNCTGCQCAAATTTTTASAAINIAATSKTFKRSPTKTGSLDISSSDSHGKHALASLFF